MIRGTRFANMRRFTFLSAFAAVVGVFSAPSARGEEPAVTATYLGMEDRQDLKFTNKGRGEFTRPVGVLTWNIPVASLSTMGLDRNFKSFCAEPLVLVEAGHTYGFAIDPIDKPSNFGLEDNELGRDTARRKAKLLRELFGRYYADTQPGSKAGPDARAAFQTAAWKIFEERELPEGPMPLNLYAGTFQANYPREAESPPFAQLAQQYVTSLTGNDAAFNENPDFAGMELVRMTGLPTASGAVPQAQLAFRLKSGAGDTAGGSLTSPTSAPIASNVGPVGVAPTFPSSSGLGGFPGGGAFGGGFPIGGGGNSITGGGESGGSSPVGTPPIETPSGGGGTGGTGGETGGGGGGGDTVPVPGPGGFILGAIAFGVYAVRRRMTKAQPVATPA